MAHLPQIITSLLDNDLYKFSMGQLFLHQFPNAQVEWTYKNRNPDTKFTQEMIDEINYQIDLYCKLTFTKPELDYLRSSGRTRFLSYDYIDYLSLWHPKREQITCELDTDIMQPKIHFRGPNTQTSYYEVPVMSIVAEVYFKMHYSAEEQMKAKEEAKRRYLEKRDLLISGKCKIGNFSEFGGRRRFSKEFQDFLVKDLSEWQFPGSKFVGTSNVYLAMKYGLTPVGTMAHEAIELVGQGNEMFNPAYSNKLMMDAWHKEFGTDLGIYLTDCITTDCFLKDFNKMNAILFNGVRHDSGDPSVWADKILEHYRALGIDARQKTLLFSDSLNFEKADYLYQKYCGRCQVAFGIGTFLTNDTGFPPMNQVIKLTEVNGIPVVKISDCEGKGMGKNKTYENNLKAQIDFRLNNPYQK